MSRDTTRTDSGSHAAASGPLTGIRIVDFSGFIAGAYATVLLGDLGADVIKVESLYGDLARAWGPFISGESRLFQGWNRNKRSVAVDLRTDEGLDIAHRLVEGADVVVENFRPGVTKRLGIDYESLRQINPRIIYASSTAFGAKGPYSERPGYDPVLQSMGGSAFLQARTNGVAQICSVAVSDFTAAMLLMGAINAALFHREKTGEGQLIETSLLQAIMAAQSHFYVKPLDSEEEGPPGIFPYRMFDTGDGPIFIAGGTDKFWALLVEEMGRPDLATDDRYETNPKRVEHAEELAEVLLPIFATRTALEWETALVEKGVPCAAVRSPEEFFQDPQVMAMDMSQVVEHESIGRLQLSGVPFHLSETPGAIQRPAPRLGGHTDEVLREIGYSDEESRSLERRGVVRRA